MTDVERLLAIEEIKQLKARYFRCVDSQDWKGFATIFTDDALMDMTEALQVRDPSTGELQAPALPGAADFAASHQDEMRPRGAKTIVDWVSSQVGGGSTVHHGHMPEIEITGPDTARGVWAMDDIVQFREGMHLKGMHGFGHYHESYARGPDGWRISSTKLTRSRLELF